MAEDTPIARTFWGEEMGAPLEIAVTATILKTLGQTPYASASRMTKVNPTQPHGGNAWSSLVFHPSNPPALHSLFLWNSLKTSWWSISGIFAGWWSWSMAPEYVRKALFNIFWGSTPACSLYISSMWSLSISSISFGEAVNSLSSFKKHFGGPACFPLSHEKTNFLSVWLDIWIFFFHCFTAKIRRFSSSWAWASWILFLASEATCGKRWLLSSYEKDWKLCKRMKTMVTIKLCTSASTLVIQSATYIRYT